MHPITEKMLSDRGLLRRLGIDLEVEPVASGLDLSEGNDQELLGRSFNLYEVPGLPGKYLPS